MSIRRLEVPKLYVQRISAEISTYGPKFAEKATEGFIEPAERAFTEAQHFMASREHTPEGKANNARRLLDAADVHVEKSAAKILASLQSAIASETAAVANLFAPPSSPEGRLLLELQIARVAPLLRAEDPLARGVRMREAIERHASPATSC
jgi:hypothetical protein